MRYIGENNLTSPMDLSTLTRTGRKLASFGVPARPLPANAVMMSRCDGPSWAGMCFGSPEAERLVGVPGRMLARRAERGSQRGAPGEPAVGSLGLSAFRPHAVGQEYPTEKL